MKLCSVKNEEIYLNNFDINKINQIKFKSLFRRRISYEPISKISSNKEFWSLDFFVNKYVLDPRPETEFLIQSINDYFSNFRKKITICDLGTGSGCLSITLAKIYTNSKITATEISKDAIEVAKKNSKIHKVQNKIRFVKCNWINKNETYDVVVSNPPYLSNTEYENCSIEIKDFEPKIALFGGYDGLKSYREISIISNSILHNKSLLFIEIGKYQKDAIIEIFKKQKLRIIKVVKDYQLNDRVLIIEKE